MLQRNKFNRVVKFSNLINFDHVSGFKRVVRCFELIFGTLPANFFRMQCNLHPQKLHFCSLAHSHQFWKFIRVQLHLVCAGCLVKCALIPRGKVLWDCFSKIGKKLSPTPCDKACRGCTHTIPAHAIYAPQLLEPKTRPGDKVRARLGRGWKSIARRDMAEAKLFFDEFRKFELQQSAFHRRQTIISVSWLVSACVWCCVWVLRIVNPTERVHAALSCHKVLCAEESIIQRAIILHRHLCWLYLCETTWASLFRTTPARCDPFICTRLVLLLYTRSAIPSPII